MFKFHWHNYQDEKDKPHHCGWCLACIPIKRTWRFGFKDFSGKFSLSTETFNWTEAK